MITLTNARQINTVLGDNTAIAGYNVLVLSPLSIDPVNSLINATIRLTSSTEPEMDHIGGTLSIDAISGEVKLDSGQLDFKRRVVLSQGQKNAVLTIISNAQDALESGLITIGVVAGVQTTGV